MLRHVRRETRKEVSDITAKYGVPPFEHLDRLGFFGGTVIVAHAVYPTPKEIRLMAEKRLAWPHPIWYRAKKCPKKASWFGKHIETAGSRLWLTTM